MNPHGIERVFEGDTGQYTFTEKNVISRVVILAAD